MDQHESSRETLSQAVCEAAVEVAARLIEAKRESSEARRRELLERSNYQAKKISMAVEFMLRRDAA